MNRYVRKALGPVARQMIWVAGHLFVKGRDLRDATRACQDFARQGVACTIGYFNADDEAPGAVAAVYLATVDALAAERLDGYLSLKIPALGFDEGLLADVVARAQRAGVMVHFDSHALDQADRTWAAIERSYATYPSLSCTLPGRWRRSLDDAELVIARGLRVRVVKGQWVDPAHPEIDRRDGFLAVIDRLAGRARHVAVASHDPPLAREALRRLRDAGTSCELELLTGLPARASMRMARELGVGVRAYVPSGVAWVPYALTQARQNPHLIPWVIKDMTIERFR